MWGSGLLLKKESALWIKYVTVKFTLEQVTKAQKGRSIALLFL
jgi:hypothetical protein